MAGGLLVHRLSQWREARRFARYEEVVSLVRQGRLKADASGDITLPRSWAWLTKNGHVYQIYDKQSGLVLLFPDAVDSYRVDWGEGKTTTGRQIAGDVYCSGPLPDNGWFTFTGMDGVSVWGRTKAVYPHWYAVTPFYD